MKHTNKMEGMVSINTSTVKNPFCIKAAKTDTVCKICYARKLEAFYGHGNGYIGSYKDNGELLSKGLLSNEDVAAVIKKLSKFKMVRFHAFGELINVVHLYNYLKIVEAAPDKTFALWSKRVDLMRKLDSKLKPKNLITIYSTPRIDVIKPVIPKGFDKVFTVYSRKFAKDNDIDINCGAKKCFTCKRCYSFDGPTYINELIKKEKKSE
jgi:hypothetical protein